MRLSLLLFFAFITTAIANAANLRGNGELKRAFSDLSLSIIDHEESRTRSESSPDDEDDVSTDSVTAALDSVHSILASSSTVMTENSRKLPRYISAASISTATRNSQRSQSSPSATTLTENSRKQSSISSPAPTLENFIPLL